MIGARSVETSEQIGALFKAQNVPHVILNAVQDEEEAEIVARAGQAGTITIATNMAGRGTDIKPSAAALEAGGLHVILTELHESPRIDRQLFGRAGRQGQVGSAQIIMSLDDPLLHAYAQGVARWLAQRFKAADGQVPPIVAGLLRLVVQRLSEKHRATIRRDTRKQDDRLGKSLGLAGQGE